MSGITILLQTLLNGLLMGGVYALIAVGLTLIFGVMKMINFAQGEFLMVGMYVTWILNKLTGGVSPYLLIVPVVIIMFLLSQVVFHTTLKPILGHDGTDFVVLTMGLAFILQSLAQIIVGANYESIIISNSYKNAAISFGGLAITVPRLVAFCFMLVFVSIVYVFLKYTDMGRAMRATSENVAVATILGVRTTRTFAVAYGMGIVMAGLSGLLITPIYYVYPTVGAPFKTIAMAVVVLGGLGDIRGAMIGGLIAGMLESITSQYVAFDFATASIYILLILVLLLKPNGLFGKVARRA